MLILAIETSCDDTCIALVKTYKRKSSNARAPMRFKILSNIISSQIKIHRKYGGVYPTLAKREHQKNLLPILIQSLKESNLLIPVNQKTKKPTTRTKKKLNIRLQTLQKILNKDKYQFERLKKFLINYETPKINAIAVTVGPGLEPCLWTGVNFARALSFWWKKPIIPINHIEAHILANWLTPINPNSNVKCQISNIFPAVCLVASGGHTELILMMDFGKYKTLGETRDDAAGECLDKIARILGLGYPGGPIIAKQAKQWEREGKLKPNEFKIKLPKPMIYQKNYDFSFSGLKTAVLYNFKSQPEKIRKSKNYIIKMCFETQQAIIDVLIYKTLKAAKDFNAKSIILGGGVTANEKLRKQFELNIKDQMPKVKILFPPKKLCTDNALMVGIAGLINYAKIKNWIMIEANANLKI